jgi:chromosome segregation ATPase
MRTPTLPALALAAVLATAGCSGDDEPDPVVAELESELAASREAQASLESRVTDLEALIAEETDGDEDPLADLRSRLVDLREDLDGLSSTVTSGEAERTDEVESLAGDVVRLDQRLAQLQSSLSTLSERVDFLTDELNSLEAQFESHRQHD